MSSGFDRQRLGAFGISKVLKGEGFPAPAEDVAGGGGDFVFFGDAAALDPKDVAGGGGGKDERVALWAGDFEVGEVVLEFDGGGHADGLVAVAGLPVAEGDASGAGP